MTDFEALVSLNMIGDIGSVRLKRLLDYFGQPEDILKAPPDKSAAVSGISANLAQRIRSFRKEDLEREIGLAKKRGLEILTYEDKDYPDNLKHIPGAPIVLYVKGKLEERDNLALAIVGSRRASFYGLNNAEKFAQDLAECGVTVVSGLARGIDTYAHRGALKAGGGRTIAVLGSGFNQLYPAENKELAEEIARKGAVISEFPMDTEPLKQNFPRRNRVISGLSLGVLVAEAAKNSGALITADFALEQGREVFALPGKIDSGTSAGANSLIKQGAKLVSCLEDILEELNLARPAKVANNVKVDNRRQPASDDKESVLCRVISKAPLALDEIAEKTGMSVAVLSDTLLRLEMKKLIRQLPGKQFIRSPALPERAGGLDKEGRAG